MFGYYVRDPERYGVVSFERPMASPAISSRSRSSRSRTLPSPGSISTTSDVVDIAKSIKPSPSRRAGDHRRQPGVPASAATLNVEKLGRGFAWLDTGTHQSLMDAGTYVRVVEDRQGTKICCPEEIAWRMGFITAAQLEKLAQPLVKSGYGEYLLDVLKHEAP